MDGEKKMSRPVLVVANVIYDTKGRFIIGKHKDGHKEDQYAFPGGKVEDETLEEAFWRELREETGLKKPKKAEIELIGLSEPSFKDKRFLVLFYATPYHFQMGRPRTVEPHKHYGWEALTEAEILTRPLASSTRDFFSSKSYLTWRGYDDY
jgi:ADP-ribose pyrophosphatase YjhB (NUDIX family)